MAVTREKTWQKVYISVADGEGPTSQDGFGVGSEENKIRQCMFEIKEALTGVASGAWTVVSSCGYDSGAWSFGAADYWVTADDVRYQEISGGQFSWVVFQQNALSGGSFQFLLALENLADQAQYPQNFYVSRSGSFTEGSATTRPTASDEQFFESYSDYWEHDVNNAGANVLVSTDGECTRILNSSNGSVLHIVCFDKLKNMPDVSVFDSQCVYGMMRTKTYYDLMCLFSTSYVLKRTIAGGYEVEWVGITPMLDKIVPSEPFMRGPEPDGAYPLSPIHVWVDGPVNFMIGTFYDVYAVSELLVDGDVLPDDGSNQFAVVGDFVIANDGTAFQIA